MAILLDSLDLTGLDNDRFEGRSAESARPRAFGGELLAQVLVAAARTTEERICHSLHATFLLPGNPALPIQYRVRRVRDGRRFAQRQVTAWQRGREILLATASFTMVNGETAEHQHEPMPQVTGPDGLRSELEHRHDVADQIRDEDRDWLLTPRAVEVRQVSPVPLVDPPPVDPEAHSWLRAIGRLSDDHNLHCAVLAYASDMTLLDIASYPHGVSWIDPRVEQASLAHAMWFHRPFRCDEWLLYAQTARFRRAAGLRPRSVFHATGALVASVAQEGCRASAGRVSGARENDDAPHAGTGAGRSHGDGADACRAVRTLVGVRRADAQRAAISRRARLRRNYRSRSRPTGRADSDLCPRTSEVGAGDVRSPPLATHILGEGHAWAASGYRTGNTSPNCSSRIDRAA